MSSRLTTGLAVFFLLCALLAAYWGVVVSRQSEPVPAVAPASVVQTPAAPVVAPVVVPIAPPPEDPLRRPVVVLLHDVPAYVPIKAEDLVIERLKVVPAGSFDKLEEVVGRSSWRTLTAGTWLSESSFEAGGALARMIRPQERAMALTVDEVIGAGGQISPGDYVDVLLYLGSDNLGSGSSSDRSSQVAVPALRVLSVGPLIGPTLDGKPVQGLSPEDRLKLEQLKSGARTVVVAVPQTLLSRLMLAASAGTLRLAVRSAEEKNLQQYWAADGNTAQPDVAMRLDSARRDLVQFSQLSFGTPVRATGAANPAAPVNARPHGVEVIRGAQVTQAQPTP